MTLRWIAGKLKMGSAESCSPLSAKNGMMKICENARPHHGDKTHEGRCSFGKPKPMVLLGVQNAEDDDSLAFDAIEQLVGESAQQDTPEITVINRLPFGIRSQHANGSASRQDKLHAQSLAPLLVLLPGCLQVRLGPQTDDDRPFHSPGRLSKRVSTSSHDEPAFGVCA